MSDSALSQAENEKEDPDCSIVEHGPEDLDQVNELEDFLENAFEDKIEDMVDKIGRMKARGSDGKKIERAIKAKLEFSDELYGLRSDQDQLDEAQDNSEEYREEDVSQIKMENLDEKWEQINRRHQQKKQEERQKKQQERRRRSRSGGRSKRQKKQQELPKSGFHGVSANRSKWQAQISYGGKRHTLVGVPR